MFEYLGQPKILQVELSTVCNALCLGCVRTDVQNYNRTKPYIPKAKYLDIDILLKVFETKAGRGLTKLEFCGNIDEPLTHPQLPELLERLSHSRSDLRVSIHTNGGYGSPELHREISELLSRFHPASNMRYSLDGLADTNHIYRQGVRWDKAIANISAAAQTKTVVIWQMLEFPWNSHQVEEAKALAQELGCKEFWLRPDRSRASSQGLEKIALRKASGGITRERPQGSWSDLRQYAKNRTAEIKCSFRDNGMLFLSWEGKVWPCCFISNVLYESEMKRRALEKYITKGYPEDFNNLHLHDLDSILEQPLYKRDLVESWSDHSRSGRRRWRCVERCSVARVRASDGKQDDKSHLEHVRL